MNEADKGLAWTNHERIPIYHLLRWGYTNQEISTILMRDNISNRTVKGIRSEASIIRKYLTQAAGAEVSHPEVLKGRLQDYRKLSQTKVPDSILQYRQDKELVPGRFFTGPKKAYVKKVKSEEPEVKEPDFQVVKELAIERDNTEFPKELQRSITKEELAPRDASMFREALSAAKELGYKKVSFITFEF